jgi:DNA-binding transcriptional LysR family regulator
LGLGDNHRLCQAGSVDLDLGQVRAFVAAAESGNFGRAAEQLQLTQQALSKRIARLEADVGTLFARRPRGVALTARGARFLPAARELLAAADAAAATARTPRTVPLRVDVWGHLHPPYTLVQAFAVARPDLVVETSMRRNLPLALKALQRREIDAALGNVAGLGRPLPPSLTSEPVTTTPLAALINTRHPLAGRTQLLADNLRQHQLWWPTEPGSPELDHFAADYARAMGVRLSTGGRNLGLEGLLEDVRSDPSLITIVSTHWPIPHDDALRMVPIRPTPHYPWYVVWPTTAAHPALAALRDHLHARGHLPEAGPDVWLPPSATW